MKIAFAVLVLAIWLPSIAPAQNTSCTDAEILALEYSGSLSPPDELTAAIDADLLAIQEFDGYFAGIGVFPTWRPSELMIQLTPAAMQEFRAGSYRGFNDLNDLYGPVTMRALYLSDLVMIEFGPCYNPLRLIPIYSDAPGVIYVEPNWTIGDGDDIGILESGRYLYTHGWGDCLAGCPFHHQWVIAVLNGEVRIIEEYGDQVATQKVTWSAVKSAYR